jgi:hypothetical protein
MNVVLDNAHSMDDTPSAQLMQQPFTLWMQGFARMQSESLRFVATRAAKDLGMPLRLARCETPAQALGVAVSFAFEAASDYAAESQRLLSLAAGDFESATAAVI